MINWKVRLKNKVFWLSVIPAVILVIQEVAVAIGHPLQLEGIQADLLNIVNALFALLAVLGVVADPTTEGVSDSTQAMTYDEPKKG